MFETLSALIVVLASIALLRALLVRAGIGAGVTAKTLRVEESCMLSGKQRVCVVRVGEKRLLVASSEAGVQLLDTLPDALPEEGTVSDEGIGEKPGLAGTLASWLKTRGVSTSLLMLAGMLVPELAHAQAAEPGVSLTFPDVTGPEQINTTLEIIGLMTLVSVAPSLLLMATCFTRVVIVLALLRQAIGIQQLPPSQVLVGLALFTTFFVMAPVGEQIRTEAYEPYVGRQIDGAEAVSRAAAPVRNYLLAHTREADLELFLEFSGAEPGLALDDVPATTLLPAYMISELRTAFEIGFMVYLPFLVVDLVIASMLISMGMIVLPPIVISLPFKLMLFVLMDGWNRVIGALVNGLA